MNIWKNGLILTLISTLFAAIFQSMDNITMHNFVKIENNFLASLCFLVYGAWNSFFVALLLTPFLGKRFIDPDYRGLSWGTKAMRRDAIFAGIFISFSTYGYIEASRIADPSIICALSVSVIIYTALIDSYKKNIQWKKVLLPTFLAVSGGLLAAYSGQWKVTFWVFFLIVFVSNLPWSLVEFAEQRGAREIDSVNFFLWRGFFLALSCTVLAVSIALLMGELNTLIMGWEGLLRYEWWIAATMVIVWLSVGLKITAKKVALVSSVMIIRSLEIIIAYPITLLGHSFRPNVFGELPTDRGIWLLRLLGAACIIIAIMLVPKQAPQNPKKTM